MKQKYFNDTPCAVPECPDYASPGMRGYCIRHYFRAYRRGDTSDRPRAERCAVSWCNHAGPYVHGLCPPHYQQQRRGTLEGGAR